MLKRAFEWLIGVHPSFTSVTNIASSKFLTSNYRAASVTCRATFTVVGDPEEVKMMSSKKSPLRSAMKG